MANLFNTMLLNSNTPVLSGLRAWYDFSNSAYLTLSSTAITQALDRSGNGNNTDVQATSTKRPTWTASQLNGLPTAIFDGGDELILPSALYSIPNGNNTIFIIYSQTAAGTAGRAIAMTAAAGAGRYKVGAGTAAGGVSATTISYNSTTSATGGVNFTPTVNANYNLVTAFRSSTTLSISVNGTSPATNANGSSESGIIDARIGSSNGGNFITGGIAEILIYNRALSALEILQVELYLSRKWGITMIFANQFVSQWKTDNVGVSSSTQITVPTVSSGTYNCIVDWGDGSTSNITTYNDAAWTHTYSIAGTYTVKITGTFNGIQFANGGDKLKLLNVSQWGTGTTLGNTGAYFHGCTNLTVTATDILSMVGTTAFNSAFSGCTSITTIPNLNSWGFTAVTTMASMFTGCTSFNQTINFTTGSSLTTISLMFNNCTLLNSTISFSTMTGITTMSNLFASCTSFNQTINFTTSSALTILSSMFNGCSAFNSTVTISNMTNVTTLANMFQNCFAFNQTINFTTGSALNSLSQMFLSCAAFNGTVTISNTTNVTTMASMFNGSTIFNQDVSAFSIAALTTATSMFTSSGFALVNYNKLLDSATGWPSQATIQSGVTFSAGTAHYSGGNAIAGRLTLTSTKTWTITDGGTP